MTRAALWTPPPWTAIGGGSSIGIVAGHHDSKPLLDAVHVASCPHDPPRIDGYANGNLIAAAPEMAAALQELLSAVHDETAFLLVSTGEKWRAAAHRGYAVLNAARAPWKR